jgi:hypothetical protein
MAAVNVNNSMSAATTSYAASMTAAISAGKIGFEGVGRSDSALAVATADNKQMKTVVAEQMTGNPDINGALGLNVNPDKKNLQMARGFSSSAVGAVFNGQATNIGQGRQVE